MKRTETILSSFLAILTMALSGLSGAISAAELDWPGDAAKAVFAASGVRGGLIVHLGCGDGRLTAALHREPAFLVHGLDADPKNVAAAREYLLAQGLHGPVSADRLDGTRLPYVDNLVNLIVVSQPVSVDRAELFRVLCPDGVAIFLDQRAEIQEPKLIKPRPPEIDDWSHFLHGPDGHVMSQDQLVGPPWHVQWVAEPGHARSHTHLTTMNVMVSAGGRLFYIADEAQTALPDELPSRWALFARDAYSGVELWRRPLRSWQPYYVSDRNSYPADLHRRLVAARDVVFATLEILGPVSALDAASGETLRVYAGTEKTEEIVHEAGVLYLSVNLAETSQINRLQMAYRHVEPEKKRILAVEAKTGRVRWDKADEQTDGLMPMTLAVKNERLYFQNPRGVVCLAKDTGQVLWTSERPSDYLRPGWSSPTLVAFDEVVISADRQSGPGQRLGKDKFAAGGFSTGDLVAFAAATGERLWSAPCAEGCRAPTDVFSRDGQLWFGQALERNPLEYVQAHDLRTGQVVREFSEDRAWPSQHHHRCYRDKATVNYILGGRTGIEFINLDTGEVLLHNWLRGACKSGILPANGFLYLPPEQCGCYIESKLTGFHALGPKRESKAEEAEASSGERLERGPAFGTARDSAPPEPVSSDWPTFRGDNARSGRVGTRVPAGEMAQAWRVTIGGRLTQPVVADGLLLVAACDAHTVHALDASSGQRRWQFMAGSRIDSPPTIAQGLAVFGCHDGWVYALRLTDGQLAWRWRVAPGERLVVDNGRVESAWPACGSVLVRDNGVYVVAGRSSYLDGGVHMARLDLHTGQPLQTRTFHSRDPQTGQTVPLYEPFPAGQYARMEMPGVLPDVLSSEGDRIWMRAVTFDPELKIAADFPPHLFCSMGFLDDSWWELTYWLYGQHMFSGRAGISRAVSLYPTARIMVCDRERVYGWQEGYEGIRSPAMVASPKTPRRQKVDAQGKKVQRLTHDWSRDLPLHVFGLVLADDTLFLAGPPTIDAATARQLLAQQETDEYDPHPALRMARDTFAGDRGGLLCALRASDGQQLRQLDFSGVPVFDGLIAARGCLFLSLRDGSVACLNAAP